MIHLSGIHKNYGTKTLFEDASLQINAGEKIGLVGPNGAGKTTLFRMLMGHELPEKGTLAKPDRLRMAYFSQDIEDMRGKSALEEVKTADPRVAEIQARLPALEAKLAEPLSDREMDQTLERYGELQGEFERLGGYDLDARASAILTGLGIGPDRLHNDTSTFSGGWKMRIALAKVLMINPDVLLMDEPTNHLDLESILWLEEWLHDFKGGLLMTSHDRDFMNRIVKRVVEVAQKKIISYTGNYDFYERERHIRLEQLVASASRQQDMLAKEKEFIARFSARASHAAQVQSRIKKLEKIDIIEVPTEEKVMAFQWPTPPRGGDEVVRVTQLGVSYDRPVFRGASAVVKRMDRVAVVGINGAGKSTFMRCVVGELEPTEGEVKIGPSIELGYFSQNSLDVLDPRATVFEEVQNRIPHSTIGFIRNLLGAFRFSGDDVEKKVGVLSGGEKSRLVLATILARPVNFLVLDEPTNHLDIRSREVLLEAVKSFPGTVMIVSHDRHFLHEITTRVFEIDRNKLTVFDLRWDEYLAKRGEIFRRASI